ncbi:hypothetical protein DO021_19660 [Desulfobacter hydrogenophilus]|uniref:Uncharacterized protein n=1 Tax=Desulfobacter hydrogenophilus TaxID=2291 RepID=A0A328FB28_9BACT|nr:hypothetical protein [Desulfobacter hydrogenophilus]NDY73988.1 hypothetical protein [Desulfobacter hydrogenophilus]QBH14333.1 hypothetical protein EYB58_16260 [Desulfobacter hydrogenophilus]RAM00335.1 hypothetical protein DO021_19660 [Desulfobacter hydrogenophilus]
MSDGLLEFGHGAVLLDGTELPGIFKSQAIAGSVRFDTAKPDGLSGTAKTPLGWEDADITLVIDLISDSQTRPYIAGSNCYDKLNQINAIFKGYDNGSNPKVYEVDNAHVLARGISHVVFSGLYSRESARDDIIQVTLNFVEHTPPVQVAEKRVVGSDAATEAAPAATTTSAAAPDETIMVDVS